MSYRLPHRVGEMADFELRDSRLALDRELEQTPAGDPVRAQLQAQLHAIVREQRERIETRRRTIGGEPSRTAPPGRDRR
jgi:hypothetical protein